MLSATELTTVHRILASLANCKAADRAFFIHHPDRRHRVRVSDPAEVIERSILATEPLVLPTGWCLYTIVKSFGPGHRIRCFVPAPVGSETDLSEDEARVIWDTVAAATMPVGVMQ